MKPRRRVAYRKKRQNRLSMFLVSMVVIMIIIAVGVSSMGLIKKKQEQEAVIAGLEKQIAQEQERSEEIEEYAKYTQTKKFVEDVAKDTLGLVHDGEILFREDD